MTTTTKRNPMASRKSWADQQGIPTGVWGEVYFNIPILEVNRATGWEFRREGVEILLKMCRENYILKGVRAIVFGVQEGISATKYAVFVQSGFLKQVTEDE
jgi:hypothetical protein